MTSPCPVDEWKQIIIHVDASRRRRVNWVERHSSRQQRAIIPPGPGSAGRRWNLLGLCNTNIQSTHRHYNTSSLTLILYFFGPSLPEWRHSQWRQSGRREKKKRNRNWKETRELHLFWLFRNPIQSTAWYITTTKSNYVTSWWLDHQSTVSVRLKWWQLFKNLIDAFISWRRQLNQETPITFTGGELKKSLFFVLLKLVLNYTFVSSGEWIGIAAVLRRCHGGRDLMLLAGGAGSTGGDGRSAGFVHLLDGQSGRGRDVARRYSLVDGLVDDDGPADYV